MTKEDLIEELKRCNVDMFEAQDKFHVLSFYINDTQAYDCAVDRVRWFEESSRRIESLLKQYYEEQNDKDRV